DVFWRLLDRTGAPTDCESFGSADCLDLAAARSPYRIEVRDFANDAPGSYMIRLNRLNAPCTCGDGVVGVGEDCDIALPDSGCCGEDCKLMAPGAICRAAAGDCDVGEMCDGSTAVCPADAKKPA